MPPRAERVHAHQTSALAGRALRVTPAPSCPRVGPWRRWRIAGALLALAIACGSSSLAAQATDVRVAASDQTAAARHDTVSGNSFLRIDFGGQIRERVESWSNFNFGALPATPSTMVASEVFALTRLMGSADMYAGSHVRVFAQGRSSLSTRRDLAGGRRPSDEDDLDVHQLYAQLRSTGVGGSDGMVTLQGGRFEMAFGKERLISALDWANTKRSFDGVMTSYGASSATVTAFLARPVVVRAYRPNLHDSTTALVGIYSTARSTRLSIGADLYWIGQRRDSGAGTWNGTAGREMRHTVGARLWSPPRKESPFDMEGEYALQFGRMGSNSIAASMVAGQIGYTVRRPSRTARVYANVEYASGDRSAGGDVETFSQLNPQPHPFLGFADIAGRQNIVDLSGGGSTNVWRTVVATADYHAFRRATATDAFYAPSGAVARPPGFGTSRSIASELDFTLRWAEDRHKLLLGGWSHVTPGDFIRQGGSASGADRSIDFTYVSLQYSL